MRIPLAHDYICPWCWIGFFQAEQLKKNFGAEFDWLGYELMPEELDWPERKPEDPGNPDRPPTPSRLDLAYAAQGIEAPEVPRPKKMRSHNALEATEYAKDAGVGEEFVARMYRAYWQEGREINNPAVIVEIAEGLISDTADLLKAIAERRFKTRIVPFDEGAYATGVFNVPTFFIGAERYAEQSYAVLEKAVEASLVSSRQ